jgi:hypothetical protein
MSITAALSLLAGVVAGALAITVLLRFIRSRSPHHAAWAAGLAFYAVAGIAEFAIQVLGGFSAVALGLWFVCGAMLTAAWIGQGTILLMSRDEHLRPISTWLLSVFSVASVVLFVLTPETPGGFQGGRPPELWYQHVLSSAPPGSALVALTVILNIYGTILVLGGLLLSAWTLWRQRVRPEVTVGNLLIALGVLLVGAASSFTHFGSGQLLPVAELLAAVLMYMGFWISGRPQVLARLLNRA